MLSQNGLERIKDSIGLGKISASEGNVQMVLDGRVRMVINSIPREVRKALNDAVKEGRLGRMKKEGLKPECYYNPVFKHLAVIERNQRAEQILRASSFVL